MTQIVWWLIIVCTLVIPFLGIMVLLKKQPNRVTQNLLFSNIGCLIMNAGFYAEAQCIDEEALIMSCRISYIGNAIFYFFFVFFTLDYLQIRYPKWVRNIWGLYEASIAVASFDDRYLKLATSGSYYKIGEDFFNSQTETAVIAIVRYGIIAVVLVAGIVYTTYRLFHTRLLRERRNLGMLAGGQLIIFVSLNVRMLVPMNFNIVPFAAALSLLAITLYVIRGEFFTVTDSGREWVFENIRDAFVITDSLYGYLDSNRNAREIWGALNGYRKSVALPTEIYELFLSEKMEAKIGDRYYAKIVSPLTQGREVMGYCLMLTEVTKAHELMEQLVAAKEDAESANEAKSAFLSNMSHEIRTPMNAIVGMTDILLRDETEEQKREYLSNIKSSGAALLTIINDILDISKIEAGRLEIIDAVYDPFAMLKDLKIIFLTRIGDKRLELLYDIDEALPKFLAGDSLRLRQIIINLVNNAIKFTENGYVKLTVKVNPAENNGMIDLFVSVQDSGQGIKEDDIGKLFGSFSQVDTKKNRNKEGTGLGLAISKQLVELMGGEIGVKSEYGSGSEFYFHFPQRIPDEKEAAELSQADDKYTCFVAPEARILIVDDNEMNLKVALGLLKPLEITIDTADSGKKALEKIQSKGYDAIFMDHMMPVMDGVEATAKIRAMEDGYFRSVPIIALSANAVHGAREMFLEAGMNDFVAKPIEFSAICKCLRKWLPEELVHNVDGAASQQDGADPDLSDIPRIEGINIEEGIKNSGTRELFLSLLGDFYRLIDIKATKIEKCLADGLLRDYTIEVHGLKNTARMIGATDLSEWFYKMEQCGNAGDIDTIAGETPALLESFRSYKAALEPFARQNEQAKEDVPVQVIADLLGTIRERMDEFDLDGADEAMKKLSGCRIPDRLGQDFELLGAYLADVAIQDVISLTEKMMEELKNA